MPSPRPWRPRLTRKTAMSGEARPSRLEASTRNEGGDKKPPRAEAGLQVARTRTARNGKRQESGRAPAELLGIAKLKHHAWHDGRDQEPAEGLDRDAGADGPHR